MRLIDKDALIDSVNQVRYFRKIQAKRIIDAQLTVDAVPVVRCKDCKHFELNHWENVHGIPLIVAHEICTKWGDGCKSSSDGYCFMAERKEE